MINLIIKDLKRAIRDKKALVIILIMPVILMTILGLTVGKFMGGTNEWINYSTIGIVNHDNIDNVSERVVETFSRLGVSHLTSYMKIDEVVNNLNLENVLLEIFESPEIKSFLSYELLSEKEALEKLDKGLLSSVIMIPQDFTYHTFISLVTPFTQRQEIEVIVNKNNQYTGKIVEEVLGGYTRVVSSAIIGKNALLEVGAELGIGDQLYSEIDKMILGIRTNTRNLGLSIENVNSMKTVNGMQYYAIAQGMMFVLYVVGFFAKYALDEKEYHTHDRLTLSGMKGSRVLLSIGISSGFMVLLQIVIFYIYSSLIFKISWGNPINVAILSVFVAFAVVGMTSLISALNLKASNAKVSNMFDAIVVIIFSLLGGSFVPLSGAPTLEKIGRLTPNGAAINGFLKIMQGYELKEVMPSIMVLSSIFIICFMSSKLVISRKEA